MNFYNSPVISEGRTLVSVGEMRDVFGVFAWTDKESIYVGNSEKKLKFAVDEKIVYENDVMMPIDVGGILLNNIGMVPLRKVAEYLGYAVAWENNAVYITSQ